MHQSSITYRNLISPALYNSYVIYDQFRSQEKHNTLEYDYLFKSAIGYKFHHENSKQIVQYGYVLWDKQ